MKVTLWGTLASEFDTDMIRALPPPVMIVLTSTKFRYFGMKKLSHADACCHYIRIVVSCYRNEYLLHLSDTAIINTGMSTCVFIYPSIPETDEYKAR